MSEALGAALESFGGSLMKIGAQREEMAERERLSQEADRRALERFMLTYKMAELIDPRSRTRTVLDENGRAYTVREERAVEFNDADPSKSTATWNEVERTQNPIPAPRTRTATVGDSNVGKQWNDKEGTWEEIPGERAPRYRSNAPGLLSEPRAPSRTPSPRYGYPSAARDIRKEVMNPKRYTDGDIRDELASRNIEDKDPEIARPAERRQVAGLLADEFATSTGIGMPKRGAPAEVAALDGDQPARTKRAPNTDANAQGLLRKARAAISSGADPAAVAARLREMGVDPSLL